MDSLNSQQWLKKWASFAGIVGAIALISFPVVAQIYPAIRLLQPLRTDDISSRVATITPQPATLPKLLLGSANLKCLLRSLQTLQRL
jgi:hypothetical protein